MMSLYDSLTAEEENITKLMSDKTLEKVISLNKEITLITQADDIHSIDSLKLREIAHKRRDLLKPYAEIITNDEMISECEKDMRIPSPQEVRINMIKVVTCAEKLRIRAIEDGQKVRYMMPGAFA
jgi:hypothetical protein